MVHQTRDGGDGCAIVSGGDEPLYVGIEATEGIREVVDTVHVFFELLA